MFISFHLRENISFTYLFIPWILMTASPGPGQDPECPSGCLMQLDGWKHLSLYLLSLEASAGSWTGSSMCPPQLQQHGIWHRKLGVPRTHPSSCNVACGIPSGTLIHSCARMPDPHKIVFREERFYRTFAFG